jgi:hypothetical protein
MPPRASARSIAAARHGWLAENAETVAARFRAGDLDLYDVIRRYGVICNWGHTANCWRIQRVISRAAHAAPQRRRTGLDSPRGCQASCRRLYRFHKREADRRLSQFTILKRGS